MATDIMEMKLAMIACVRAFAALADVEAFDSLSGKSKPGCPLRPRLI